MYVIYIYAHIYIIKAQIEARYCKATSAAMKDFIKLTDSENDVDAQAKYGSYATWIRMRELSGAYLADKDDIEKVAKVRGKKRKKKDAYPQSMVVNVRSAEDYARRMKMISNPSDVIYYCISRL
jgi:hypothetical protein